LIDSELSTSVYAEPVPLTLLACPYEVYELLRIDPDIEGSFDAARPDAGGVRRPDEQESFS